MIHDRATKFFSEVLQETGRLIGITQFLFLGATLKWMAKLRDLIGLLSKISVKGRT